MTDDARPEDRRERGIAMYARQFGVPEDQVADHMAGFLGRRMAEEAIHASGGSWSGDGLSMRERSLIVISSLISQGGVEGRLRGHLRWAEENGLPPEDVEAAIVLLAGYVGYPRASTAMELLRDELGPVGE
jgi:4-carboxymuconolactone decarboxylase